MLPSENENKKKVNQEHGDGLARAAKLLKALVPFPVSVPTSNRPGSGHAIQASMLLCMEAFIRFRSIIALCKLGHTTDAAILSRSLFETFLATRFIVRPLKRLLDCSTHLKSALVSLPNYPSGLSKKDFRAKLYCSSPTIKLQRLFDDLSTTGTQGHADEGKEDRKRLIGEIKLDIGEEWFRQIYKTKSYNGIRQVKLVAECYGMEEYYSTVYSILSSMAHGEGAEQYLGGRNASMIPLTINLSGAKVAQMVKDISSSFRVHLGSSITKAIREFEQAIQNSSN